MRKPLVLVILTSFASLANASYYVVDSPSPPPPVSALIRSTLDYGASQQDQAPTVMVPFIRRATGLSRDAIRVLSAMLDDAGNAGKIAITGCGDPGETDSIAYRRATNIKAWLIDNGISSSTVATSADGKVIKTPKGFSCVVRLTTPSSAPSSVSAYAQLVQSGNARPALTQLAQGAPVPPSPVVQQPTVQQPDRTEQMRLIDRVLDMAKAKVITGDNAVAMIAQLMHDCDSVASPLTPKVITAAIMSAPITAQITAMPVVYSLTSGRTLRDTLSDWARTAGWKQPVWSASNPYLIAQGQNLNGDFMGALRTVSDLVPGLDFRVNTATREITVTDATR